MIAEPAETTRSVSLLQPHERKRPDWPTVVALARAQHGVVSLAQLVECGFSPSGVRMLCSKSKLHRVHVGVYALGPAGLSGEGNRMAAVLACGPGSLLAARSAAGHHGLITNSSSVIDVMTPRQVRRKGIRAHQLPMLEERDRTERDGVPCTSVPRTLLDLAAGGRAGELRAALEQAEELGSFDLNAINDLIDRNAGHRGVGRLRSSLTAMALDGPDFRSRFERRFLPITIEAGMPAPLVNHVLQLPSGPMEVDFYWPSLRLVVEVDGYEFHRRRRQFRNDRRRDRRLAAVGIRCLRYVWEDLDHPDATKRELVDVARKG